MFSRVFLLAGRRPEELRLQDFSVRPVLVGRGGPVRVASHVRHVEIFTPSEDLTLRHLVLALGTVASRVGAVLARLLLTLEAVPTALLPSGTYLSTRHGGVEVGAHVEAVVVAPQDVHDFLLRQGCSLLHSKRPVQLGRPLLALALGPGRRLGDDLLVASGLLAGEVEGRQTVVVQRSDAAVGQLATSLVARELDAEWKGNVANPHGCCGRWVSWSTIATLFGVATFAVGIASVIPGHIRQFNQLGLNWHGLVEHIFRCDLL